MILGTLGHNTSLLVMNILYHQAGVHYKSAKHNYLVKMSTHHTTIKYGIIVMAVIIVMGDKRFEI